jgi:hypothetical protein
MVDESSEEGPMAIVGGVLTDKEITTFNIL